MGQLMEAAERLFALKGVAGTSLQELADAIGVTRTGIYHYVSGKEEMLQALVEGFTLPTAKGLEILASEKGRPVAVRLHDAMSQMALRIAQNPQRFRLLLTSEGAFPEALAKQYRSARRRTLVALETLVQQAIKEGVCRPINARLASFSLLGSCNWLAFWYPHTDGIEDGSPEGIAKELATIALQGILTSRPATAEDKVSYLLGLLRDDLDRLQVAVDNNK